MKFKVSVPATSANLGPGYDIWGIAVDIYNEFTVKVTGGANAIQPVLGPLAEKTSDTSQNAPDLIAELSNPQENLLFQGYRLLFEKRKIKPPGILVRAEINIPLARGLGSSSTAVLGGLVIANEILRKRHSQAFTIDEIFRFATEMEGHPDNVAPAIWGGWVAGIRDFHSKTDIPLSLPWRAPVRLGGVVPHIPLSTARARQVVEKTVPTGVVAGQAGRTALMTHLMSLTDWTTKEKKLLQIALDDQIHQNARAALIPGMKRAMQNWMARGALGVYLSGAGTTLLAFWDIHEQVDRHDLTAPFREEGVEATQIHPSLDRKGLIIEHL